MGDPCHVSTSLAILKHFLNPETLNPKPDAWSDLSIIFSTKGWLIAEL